MAAQQDSLNGLLKPTASGLLGWAFPGCLARMHQGCWKSLSESCRRAFEGREGSGTRRRPCPEALFKGKGGAQRLGNVLARKGGILRR